MSTKQNDTMVINKTDDASIFKYLTANRHISKNHVRRLKEAISVDAECIKYNPIIVNEKMEIIDGQHRVNAIRELDLPIYYLQVKGLNLVNAQDLNVLSKPWRPVDYAISFAELGNKNYEIYLDFKNEYSLNHDLLQRYLSLDNPITTEMFKTGKLKVKNVKKSNDLCQKLIAIGEYYNRYKSRPFALAFQKIWSHPNFNFKRLMAKLEAKPGAIIDRALPEDYIRDIEKLYNHGLDESSRIRFF